MSVLQRGWRFLFMDSSAIGRDWGLSGSLIFEPRDLWIGIYWDGKKLGEYDRELTIYVCLLPCLPIRLHYWRYQEGVPF